MFIAGIVFFASLVGIIALFAVKYWEIRAERVIAPEIRERADERAREFKAALLRARREAAKLPPSLLTVVRYVIHEAALGLAKLARTLERKAHDVADFVSYKRGFERRQTNSQFLKQVSEAKNGNTAE